MFSYILSIGWLEPLLQRIAVDYRNVAIPLTDNINSDTFEYVGSTLNRVFIGGLTFDLYFAWIPIPEKEEKRRVSLTDPIRYCMLQLLQLLL